MVPLGEAQITGGQMHRYGVCGELVVRSRVVYRREVSQDIDPVGDGGMTFERVEYLHQTQMKLLLDDLHRASWSPRAYREIH